VPTLTTYYSLTKPDLGQADPSEWGTSVDANFDTIDIELHNRVLLSPGSPQTGSFNLTGNGVLGGDLTTGTLHTGGLSTLGGNVAFSADNTYDIGPGGVSRPRDVTVARDVNVGRNLGVVGTLGVTGTTVLTGGLAGSLAFATDNVYDIGPGGVSRPRDVTAGRDVNVGRNLGVVGDGLVGGTFGVTGLLTASAGIAVAGGQRITLGASGQGLPTFTTVSAGEKVTLFSVIDGTHVNYALGEASNTLWISIPQAVSGYSFSWRGGTTEVMKLDGAGALTVTTLNAGTLLFTDGQISGNLSVGGTFRVNFPNVNQFIVSGDTVTAGIWNGQAILDAYVADDLTIVAGTVNNTPIGATTPATGKFTTLQATGNTTLATVVAGLWNGTIIADAYLSVALAGHTISGGSISGTPISGSTGSFTTLASSGLATLNSLSVTTTLGVTGTSTLGVLGAGATTVTTLHATSTSALDGNVTVGASILPSTIWTSDLGSQAFKMRDIYAQSLNVSTLVSQDVLSTIGGRILVGLTTSLVADVATGDTAIVVKHNNLSTNDTVLLQTAGQYEWLLVTSNPVASGNGYSVNVTRNLAGNGAKAWKTGDAVFNTGQAGNGYWDFFSQNSSLAYPLDFIYNHDNAGNSDTLHELGNYSVNYAQSANWTIFGDNAGTETHDSVYFGVQNTTWNTLAFYIGTAAGSLCTFVWEFWNGSAWTTFTPTQTGGANFGTLGWNQVAWSASSLTGWASKTVNSQTAYWVRVRISVFGSGFATKPVQTSKRVVYNSGANTSALYLWQRTAIGSTTNWNALSAALVLGDLAGAFGYTAQTYGLVGGDYSGGNYFTLDPAGAAFLGAGGRVKIGTGGIQLYQNVNSVPTHIGWYRDAFSTLTGQDFFKNNTGLTQNDRYSVVYTEASGSRGATYVLGIGKNGDYATRYADITFLGSPGASDFGQITLNAIHQTSGANSTITITPWKMSFTMAGGGSLSAGSENVFFDFQPPSETWPSSPTVTTQRLAVFHAASIGFTAAYTLTNAATVAITGAPVAGTNATLTNTYALWVQAGASQFDGAVELTSTFHQKASSAQVSVENSSDSGGASTFCWQSTASSFAFLITRAYGHTAAGTTLGLNNVDLTELRSNLGSALLVYTVNNVPLVFGTNNAEVARFSGAGAFTLKGDLAHQGTNLGFYNTAATTKKTVTGSRAGNAALASLLTQLAAYGLITDSSS
jgi:hypothetical protein